MRIIDFLIYYSAKLYENKPRGNLYWNSPIKRAAFNVTITLTLWLFAVITLFVFFIWRLNIILMPYIKLAIPFLGLLVYQIVAFFYIKKDRYELMKSSSYNSFSWSEKSGGAISFLILVGGIFAVLAAEVLMDALQR